MEHCSILLLWTAINRCRSVLLMRAKDNAGKISGNTFRVVNFSNAINHFLLWRLPERKEDEVTLLFVPGGASSFVFHW